MMDRAEGGTAATFSVVKVKAHGLTLERLRVERRVAFLLTLDG